MKQLNEFETLEEAKVYTGINQKLLTSNEVECAFVVNGLHEYLTTSNSELMVFVRNVLSRNGEFDFRKDSEDGQLYTAMLNAMVDAEPDSLIKEQLEALKVSVLAQANEVIKPYANTTQATFNRAKGIYNQKEVVGFSKNQVVLLTLNEELPESCLAYLYDIDEGFEDKYFGKAEPIKPSVNKYKITPPVNAKPNGKLFVRIPFDIDFSVEIV